MVMTASAYNPVVLRFARLSEGEARERSLAFLARLSERRSVRRFSPDPVPHELIENAIRAAGTAPSGANQQPWSFVVLAHPPREEGEPRAARARGGGGGAAAE